MDDFERDLERELARMLNPIVETPAPRRRRHAGTQRLRMIAGGLAGIPGEMCTIAEQPVAIAVPTGRLS